MSDPTCINPLQIKCLFLHVWSMSLLKTLWKKEKLLVTSNFSFPPPPPPPSGFYSYGDFSAIFHQVQNSCLQVLPVWKRLKFVILERVKPPFPGYGSYLNVFVKCWMTMTVNPFPNTPF